MSALPTPHNLDIEISALREGWTQWCKDWEAREAAHDARCELLGEALEWLIEQHGFPPCAPPPERLRAVLELARDRVAAKPP